MSRDDATLRDILRAARLAVEFLGDLDPDRFQTDLKTQSSVIHQLLIIGEAVKRLSPVFRDEHPDVPWKQIAGMRDVMMHSYDKVDLDEVWNAVHDDIRQLLGWLERQGVGS
jgi:uncharacterized protein with HEPN domain